MRVYTFTQARQQLASLLDCAQKEGAVRIRHRDGRAFTLQPATTNGSPLDVKGVVLPLDRKAIVAAVRESRSRYTKR